MQKHKTINQVLTILIVLLLLGASTIMPFAYYTFLGWAMFFGCGWLLIFTDFAIKEIPFIQLIVIIGIFFPLFDFSFPQSAWVVIDLFTVLILISLFSDN